MRTDCTPLAILGCMRELETDAGGSVFFFVLPKLTLYAVHQIHFLRCSQRKGECSMLLKSHPVAINSQLDDCLHERKNSSPSTQLSNAQQTNKPRPFYDMRSKMDVILLVRCLLCLASSTAVLGQATSKNINDTCKLKEIYIYTVHTQLSVKCGTIVLCWHGSLIASEMLSVCC